MCGYVDYVTTHYLVYIGSSHPHTNVVITDFTEKSSTIFTYKANPLITLKTIFLTKGLFCGILSTDLI